MNAQYQDLVESLKINKEVKGLAKYVDKYYLPVLNTKECQTVKDAIECLEKKYERTRFENLEELVADWLKVKGNDFDDEDDFIQAME